MKAQAAMEFMLTYGWAILIVMATVSVVYYYGLVDVDKVLPESCIIAQNIECLDARIDSNADEVYILLENDRSDLIRVTNVTAISDELELRCVFIDPGGVLMRTGDRQAFTLDHWASAEADCEHINDISFEQAKFNIEVSWHHEDSSAANSHTASGTLIANVEQEEQDAPDPEDWTPPVQINPLPVDTSLPSDTVQVIMGFDTNEPADCKFHPYPGENYDDMDSDFSTTGGVQHRETISGLVEDTTYRYYTKCEDQSPNQNQNPLDFVIQFTVRPPDTTPPQIVQLDPSGFLPSGTTNVDLVVSTDELADCRYDVVPGTAYDSMPNLFVTTNSITHTDSISGLSDGDTEIYYVRCQDQSINLNQNPTDAVLSFTIEIGPDVTPPVLSNGLPTGTLPTGTTNTNLTITTNEAATCKFDTSSGIDYASMANTFTVSDGITHNESLNGLVDGQAYTYYARCEDSSGNANTADFIITFDVAPGVPPVISGGSPSGTLASGTTSTPISVNTDEAATCKWDTDGGEDFSVMANTFSTTGGTSHSDTYGPLSDGQAYTIYVRCEDTDSNANTVDYLISFDVSAGAAPAPYFVEMEDLTHAGGFTATTNCVCGSPSGGECARHEGTHSSETTATLANFPEGSGTYDVAVRYCDEDDDGTGDVYRLLVDGTEEHTWTTTPNGVTGWRTEMVTVNIDENDPVVVGATCGTASSWCRADYVDFTISGTTPVQLTCAMADQRYTYFPYRTYFECIGYSGIPVNAVVTDAVFCASRESVEGTPSDVVTVTAIDSLIDVANDNMATLEAYGRGSVESTASAWTSNGYDCVDITDVLNHWRTTRGDTANVVFTVETDPFGGSDNQKSGQVNYWRIGLQGSSGPGGAMRKTISSATDAEPWYIQINGLS